MDVSAHVAPPYGSFLGWLIPLHLRSYIYARPAACL